MKTVDNDIQKIREGSVALRKTADLFDRLADTLENEELNEKEKECILEGIMGQIMFQGIKAQMLFE